LILNAALTAGAAQVPEAQRALALSSDRMALSADVTFPYQLNGHLAWKVFTVLSPTYEALLLCPLRALQFARLSPNSPGRTQ
jgi:hypothetical protein